MFISSSSASVVASVVSTVRSSPIAIGSRPGYMSFEGGAASTGAASARLMIIRMPMKVAIRFM